MSSVIWNCTTGHKYVKSVCGSSLVLLTHQIFTVHFTKCWALLGANRPFTSPAGFHVELGWNTSWCCPCFSPIKSLHWELFTLLVFSFVCQFKRMPWATVKSQILCLIKKKSAELMWCNKQKLLWYSSHVLYSKYDLLPQVIQNQREFPRCKTNHWNSVALLAGSISYRRTY